MKLELIGMVMWTNAIKQLERWLGGLRLESPTLVTKNGAEVLPKTPFEVDYV